MEHTDRDDLRRLAMWLSRRRAIDEALGVLTAYGPAAGDRVHAHLEALRSLLDLERAAFDAVCAAAPRVPQLPLPDLMGCQLVPERAGADATVHSMDAARDRHPG